MARPVQGFARPMHRTAWTAPRQRFCAAGAFDRPFVFNVVGGERSARQWEIALRSAYLTGRPYTPFQLALLAWGLSSAA